MTLLEERQELMRIANELHAELQAHNKRVNLVINKLIGESDALKLASYDGITKQPKVQQITFSAPSEPDKFPEQAVVLGKGKRACSLCRQPGHRAQNCPNAHVIQQNKKAAVELREAKKRRKK